MLLEDKVRVNQAQWHVQTSKQGLTKIDLVILTERIILNFDPAFLYVRSGSNAKPHHLQKKRACVRTD